MARKLKKATETATETAATPRDKLRDHVTGAIERGEAVPIVEVPPAALASDGLAFTVERKEFASVLRKLVPLAPRAKRSLPILANVAIKATTHGGVVLAVTDLDLWAVYAAPAWTVHGEGAICVNAKALLDTVSKLDDGPITLRVGAAPLSLGITSGSAHVTLQATHARDYPKLPAVLPDDPVVPLTTVDACTLRELIEATESAICQDQTRFHLNGVLFEYDGTTARTVATDGHRLALAQREMPRAGDFATKGTILPERACAEIRKLCKGPGTVDFGEIKGGLFVARRSGLTLVSKRIDAQFPPYEQVIPKDNSKLFTLDRNALIGVAKRALPLCSDTRGLVLRLKDNALRVEASHPDRGEFAETFPCERAPNAPEWCIGVNPRYLVEALDALEGDHVTIALGGDDKPNKWTKGAIGYQMDPILIRSTADATTRPVMASSRLVVVMPMRM